MEEKPQDPQKEVEIQDKNSKRKRIVILLVALIGFNSIIFGAFYFSLKDNRPKEQATNPIVRSENNISPTPFPFQDMTIPYLRSRSYESNLNEVTVNSQNSEYTSYLTSYDSDGNNIYGQLTVPVGDAPSGGWPAIIFVHGYIPPASYQTFSNYAAYVDYLARNGFVVFKIDLRGHGESEGEPGGAYYSSDYIVDVLNAYSALGKHESVNPKKIGLWGHSMAGNVVSRALGAKPDIPAIVIWAGAVYTYSDFSEYSIDDNSYQPPSEQSPSRRRRAEMFEKYGQFNPESEFWKQVPVTNYLSDIKGAISLNHSTDDDVVDIGYSRNFNQILNKTNIPHELNEYSSGGHNISGTAFNQAMANTVEFFQQYLK